MSSSLTPAEIVATAAEPTGASLAFTTTDAHTQKALNLVQAGLYAQAEQWLNWPDSTADAKITQARHELLDLISRMRYEFSLDEAGLLKNIQTRLPTATQADLDNWKASGDLHPKTIDGQTFYFRREAQNLFLFCNEAKQRLGAAPQRQWKLVDHLRNIVDAAKASGQTEVMPVQHHVEFSLTVHPDAPGVQRGAVVKIWLPYPQEYRQQKNIKLLSATPATPTIAPSAMDGNPVQHAQRTAYFEQIIQDPAKPNAAKISYEFTSYAYYPQLDERAVQPLPADWNGAYLSQRLPHIAFTPAMRETVKQIVGSETNPLAKARKIFHWVSANIPWNAEQEYCIIPSLSQWGFTRRRGDCGVQGTLFITLCRIAGIPARWQSGWETKLDKSSMHDWSEIYIAPYGWLPCDASYGVQKSDDPAIADFYLGHQDSHRIIFNLDYGREFCPAKQSLRSEPTDLQRGEVEIDGQNLYFNQWDYSARIWVDGKEIN